MANTKTDKDHNLLTKRIEKSKHMEYYDQKVDFIDRVVEDFRNNTLVKGARFSQRYFLHKGLKSLYKKGVMR